MSTLCEHLQVLTCTCCAVQAAPETSAAEAPAEASAEDARAAAMEEAKQLLAQVLLIPYAPVTLCSRLLTANCARQHLLECLQSCYLCISSRPYGHMELLGAQIERRSTTHVSS